MTTPDSGVETRQRVMANNGVPSLTFVLYTRLVLQVGDEHYTIGDGGGWVTDNLGAAWHGVGPGLVAETREYPGAGQRVSVVTRVVDTPAHHQTPHVLVTVHRYPGHGTPHVDTLRLRPLPVARLATPPGVGANNLVSKMTRISDNSSIVQRSVLVIVHLTMSHVMRLIALDDLTSRSHI